MSTTKTHTQATDTYFGSDLLAGMIWVDGYGSHYLIKEVSGAAAYRIVDGFLSTERDFTRTTVRLQPERGADIVVTVDNADEFDIAKA